LLSQPQRLKAMASNTSSLGVINSADLLADLIESSVQARSIPPSQSINGA
jgi:UDP-N-acetylglucosamine--N-acetylmuramyl-(pentapeptide) pyrophosphoryl-undecaprenol N-acetylglucosamine transferase